jgi:hypothetical protein
LGSFLLGLGVTAAGGRVLFVAVFVLFFTLVYSRTIRGEAQLLEQLFGEQYRDYAENVPLFLPRLTAWRAAGASLSDASSAGAPAFSLERWRRNREYEALLGAFAGFAFLALRMWML